jgi:hypothetical protein
MYGKWTNPILGCCFITADNHFNWLQTNTEECVNYNPLCLIAKAPGLVLYLAYYQTIDIKPK